MGDHADDAIDRDLAGALWDVDEVEDDPFVYGFTCRRSRPVTVKTGFHPWKAQPRTMQALKDAIDAKRQKGKKMPPPKRKPPTAQGNASAGAPSPVTRLAHSLAASLSKRTPPARKPGAVPGAGVGKPLAEVFAAEGAAFPVSIQGHTPSDELTTLVVGAMFDVMKPGAKAFPSIQLTQKETGGVLVDIRAASNGRFVYWWLGGVLYALRLDDVTNAVLTAHRKRGG